LTEVFEELKSGIGLNLTLMFS